LNSHCDSSPASSPIPLEAVGWVLQNRQQYVRLARNLYFAYDLARVIHNADAEGALWGSIKGRGFLPDTVIVSDDAGQFNVGQVLLPVLEAGEEHGDERKGEGLPAATYNPSRWRAGLAAGGARPIGSARYWLSE
jgi:hypothetical protein